MSIQTILEIEPGRQVHLPSLLSRLVAASDALAVVLSGHAESVGKAELLPIAEELVKLAVMVRSNPK